MNDVQITEIKTDLAPAIFKSITSSGRPGFGVRVTYKLVDGREFPGTVDRQRKKDVLPAVDSAKRAAAAGAMSACFTAEGKYWGTSQRWQIGPIGGPGLVPRAMEGATP